MKAMTDRAKTLAAKPDPFNYHAPSTQRYRWGDFNTSVRGGAAAQYGAGSDYYNSLDEAGKQDFISKYGRNIGALGVTEGRANYKTPGAREQGGPARFQRKDPTQINSPKSSTGGAVRTSQAEDRRNDMLEKAYSSAASNAYALKDVKDQAILDQLGKAGRHQEWKEVLDRVSGNSLGYRLEDTNSGRGGALRRSWENNQHAWQAGIGAVTGLITGGPAGMVIGGATGYARGSAEQKAKKAQRQAERQVKKKQTKEVGVTPRGMRDVARSRAAGAGTFNYNESVGA